MKSRWKLFVLPVLTMASVLMFAGCDDDDDMKASDLPESIQQNFQNQYPNVQWAEWESEWGNYKVDFFFSGDVTEWGIALSTQAEAWYSPEGEWIRTEFSVENYYFNPSSTDIIPQAVRETIAGIAAGRHVDDIDCVDLPGGAGNDYFDVEIENEPNDINIRVALDGTQIK